VARGERLQGGAASRAPGEEDSGDRKLAEKNGLKYLTLTVSAEALSAEIVSSSTPSADAETYPVRLRQRRPGGGWAVVSAFPFRGQPLRRGGA
jgi:hypothetical protein